MVVLGISGLYHDSAAALIVDGEIIAAAQEERFTRIKHDSSFPYNAIEYCMLEGKVKEIDAVVYYDMPALSAHRFVANLQFAGNDCNDLIDLSLEPLVANKLWIHHTIEECLSKYGIKCVIYTTLHHISHAASAFFPSPYDEAAILTIDGVGEWATTTIGIGRGNEIELKKEIRYPDSLGLLYSAFTYFCGFKVNSGDYKLMGLAPYGEPVYCDVIKSNLIDIKDDGSYRLNMDYFDYQYGRAMTNQKFADLFGGDRRLPESEITKREMDIAASIQMVIEEVVIRLARTAKRIAGDNVNNLVMAGGVALNCVANGKLREERVFDNIWVQPAAGDAGGALGAALFYYYQVCNNPRIRNNKSDIQKGSYLGPQFNNKIVEECLNSMNIKYERLNDEELVDILSDCIMQEKVIGLCRGRMEFGPRALGNRSIIADAKSVDMQSKMNLKIKYRESFRPFAPSCMAERVSEYFDIDCESPYMLMCADVKKERCNTFDLHDEIRKSNGDMLKVINIPRSDLPAITHVNYSARIQTVSEEQNPFYYKLLKTLCDKSGVGVIVNTSFNVRGEPIVCTPKDAVICFMRTDMDVLLIENCLIYKEQQDNWDEGKDWMNQYELD